MASIPGDFASRRLSDYEDSLKCLGMRSELLFYQRRSVSTMLLKERQRGRSIPDPLYSAVNSVDLRKTFFLQPGTLELVREQPMVEAPCGGILCEELGEHIRRWSIFDSQPLFRDGENCDMLGFDTVHSPGTVGTPVIHARYGPHSANAS